MSLNHNESNKNALSHAFFLAGLGISYMPSSNADHVVFTSASETVLSDDLSLPTPSNGLLNHFIHSHYTTETINSSEELVNNFAKKVLDGMEEMPNDFAKTLRDNFWDLL